MASPSKVGGYVCEIIDPISEDFLCRACTYVAREPTITSCCGETFCLACNDHVREGKKPCPFCKEAEFTTMVHQKYWERILALQACCTVKDRGCEWTGKLGDLDAHLDTDTGDCQYADVPCPGCSQQVQRRELATHLRDECPKREYDCRYCGFTSTYEDVCNNHLPVCEKYPVPCPNECSAEEIERCTLNDHLKLCPLQEIECEFQHAGCNEKFQRQDLVRHMEANTQNHLVLMSAATLTISQQLQEKQSSSASKFEELECKFERKLEEQQNAFEEKFEEIQHTFEKNLEEQERMFEEKLREKGKKMEEAEAKITGLQQQLNERGKQVAGLKQQLCDKHTQVEELQQGLKQNQQQIDVLTELAGVPPCRFTMPKFTQMKKDGESWNSPPMYTELRGYRFCIVVKTKGPAADGTCVSVGLCVLQGKFDSQLQWPAKRTITLQLLNQYRDRDHITATEEFELQKPTEKKQFVGYFSDRQRCQRFIGHKDLQCNDDKQTQYLKDDCLQFRVEVKK